MPLHVPDASDGLHLRAAGSELIEMLELALLQQELAATVAGELVAHPAEERGEKKEDLKARNQVGGSRNTNTDVPNNNKESKSE